MSYIFKLNRKENKVSLRHTRNVFKLKHVGRQGLKGDNGKDGVVQKVIAGQNVSVDDSDPANPIISSIGDLGTRWGGITGNINDQTDLQSVIDNKADKTSLDALNVELHMIEDELYQDIQQGDSATLSSANLYTDTKILSINKGSIGLGNVDNTSDLDKPVSTATQSALNSKVDRSSAANVLYGRNTANVEAAIPMTETAATPWTIPRRDSAGRIKVVAAAAVEDAVNKAQMDTADALKVSKAGDTMTGKLDIGLATGDVAYSQSRAGTKIKWGVGSNSVFGVYNETSSVELLNVWANNLRLGTQSGVGFIYGTGFPNGVVSAPVGSIYIDSSVTNGASSWIKKSGTGNTGWQVLEGDTGWRVLVSWDSAGVVTGTMPGNMSPKAGRSGDIRIRRRNSTVEVFMREATFTAGIVNIASYIGFRSASPYFPTVPIVINTLTSLQVGTAFYFITATAGSMQNDYGASAFFETTSDWPTTLPGTAA